MPKKPTSRASNSPALHSATRTAFFRQLTNPNTIDRYFRSMVSRFFPGAGSVVDVSYTHRPALSTTSFLTAVEVVTRKRGQTQRWHVRGNTVDRQTYTIFRRLASYHQPRLRLPRPLTFINPPGYIWYEEVGGRTLRDKSFSSPLWPVTLGKIGTGLAVFHGTPARGLRPLTWTNEVRTLRRSQQTIARRAPHLAGLAQRVDTWLLDHERAAWNHHPVLVHKDFQASNIITGPRIGFIDFTLSGIGPAAFDLGTFLSHLGVMTLGHVAPARLRNWRQSFLRGYRRSISVHAWHIVQRDTPVFEVRSLFDILAITLTTLGWQHLPGRKYVGHVLQQLEHLTSLRP